MKHFFLAWTAALIPALMLSCAPAKSPADTTREETAPEDLTRALESITGEDLLTHIRTLSSDEYEGRAPGTKGEDLTVAYLTGRFQSLGLKPGNPDGTYLQQVPLVGFTAASQVWFVAGDKKMALKFPDQYIAVSRRLVPEVKVQESDIVFVGYGVVAPEYGWDDYKGVDLRGKTLVMLVNDPPVPDPKDPSRLDDKMFQGKAMTYYGRWTYKYEIASEKGAAAAVIVHETGPAGYPYEVVSGSWGRENFDIEQPDKNMQRVAVESWIPLQTAKELCRLAGQDFDALKKAALRKDFKPVPFKAKASFLVKNTLRRVSSRNVVARLEGSDPKRKDHYVVYSAHWDHLGRDEKLKGDQIYNGAVDNASGTASLLELAEAFTRLGRPPRRSILFLAATAEEQGLLGAKYYTENPLYALARTAANINIDGVNQWGRTRDIVLVGFGNSTLDDVAGEVARTQQRVVRPDPEPEKGLFYRSDHFEFAKKGVPALDPDAGMEFIGKPAEYGLQKRREYTANDYHKVSDEIKPDWDLSGAVEDVRFLFQVGYRIAEDPELPQWKPGAEFKTVRNTILRSR